MHIVNFAFDTIQCVKKKKCRKDKENLSWDLISNSEENYGDKNILIEGKKHFIFISSKTNIFLFYFIIEKSGNNFQIIY